MNSFSIKNYNFWLSLLIAFFGILTAVGVELPTEPQLLAGEILTTVSSTGWFGLIGTMGASLFGLILQIYNKYRAGGWNIPQLLGSPNTVIYLAGVIGSLFVINGINVPVTSLPQLAERLYAADYFGALTALITILSPLIRWFRDRRATVGS
jgi:hypothetical protein